MLIVMMINSHAHSSSLSHTRSHMLTQVVDTFVLARCNVSAARPTARRQLSPAGRHPRRPVRERAGTCQPAERTRHFLAAQLAAAWRPGEPPTCPLLICAIERASTIINRADGRYKASEPERKKYKVFIHVAHTGSLFQLELSCFNAAAAAMEAATEAAAATQCQPMIIVTQQRQLQ